MRDLFYYYRSWLYLVKLANIDRIDSIPDNKALTKPVSLGSADTLKVTLTAREGSSGKRAHQVFLLLQDPETGLDISYPFDVKENGKSRVELVRAKGTIVVWHG